MLKLEDDLLKNLRCKSCNNYLSVAPVILTKNGKNICGRCIQDQTEHDKPELDGSRNHIYEHVISILKFPCQYNEIGCKETFVCTHIGEHEENCSFRKYNCPMFSTRTECKWVGQRSEIRDHFLKKHAEHITQYPCLYKPPIEKTMNANFLMTMCGFNFFLQVKVDSEKKKMWHRVRFLGEPYLANLFGFGLEIKSSNSSVFKTNPIQMKEQFVMKESMVTDIESIIEILGPYESLDFKIRILMNNTKNCEQTTRKFDKIDRNNEIVDSYNEMNTVGKNSNDTLIESKNKRKEAGDELDINENSICEKLRCGNCNAYLSYGPIMMTVQNGLNICGRCCHGLKDKYPMVRNEVYELVAPLIQYPCRYDQQGCRKTLRWNLVEEHEKYCYFASYQCPVVMDGRPCPWVDCKDNLKTHFIQCHPTLVVENPCTFKPDIRYENESFFLIIAFELPFILQIKCLGARSKIYHRVYYLGEISMVNLFRYELDVRSSVGILKKSEHVHVYHKFSLEDCMETDIEGLLLILGSYDDITFQVSIIMGNGEEEYVKDAESDTRVVTETIQGIKRISINYPKDKSSQKIEIKFNKSSTLKSDVNSVCELERDITITIPQNNMSTSSQIYNERRYTS